MVVARHAVLPAGTEASTEASAATSTAARTPASPRARVLLSAVLCALFLAGCGASQSGPQWTPVVPGSASASASPAPSGSTSAGATSAQWKTFTDPGKTISFELPAQWIVQSAPLAPGSAAGAVHYDVKKADGTFVAGLQTGLPVPTPQPCDAGQAKPYTVLNSVPVNLPFQDGPTALTPRFVFRVIQGYKYFGSFGLVGVTTSAQDGKACRLLNIVPGPTGTGGYAFSDVTELAPLAANAEVAPLQAFDNLAQASDYVRASGDFADAQRMIMSLKFTKTS
ncbi:hypothetical protein [Sinomonas susongensis]|uniref:hypothetical protein n=1 Tax=Sinomonas susongensis TaxID=1324851 RepID=UPI001FE7672B|nr:hypothetical protein [Sinomonas susongensis]